MATGPIAANLESAKAGLPAQLDQYGQSAASPAIESRSRTR
jgi:hypothetical protein